MMTSRRKVWAALAGAALLGPVACRSLPRRDPLVSGTITYRGPIGLRPDDEIRVRVLDRANVGRPPIAEQRIQTEQQVPIPFSLAYDTNVIGSGADLVIEAQIWRSGRVLFATPAPVTIDPAQGTTDLVLELQPAEA